MWILSADCTARACTSAAPRKPLPPAQPDSECSGRVSQEKGQKERFRNASCSRRATVLQVFRTVPSGRTMASRGSPFSIRASGSLHGHRRSQKLRMLLAPPARIREPLPPGSWGGWVGCSGLSGSIAKTLYTSTHIMGEGLWSLPACHLQCYN